MRDIKFRVWDKWNKKIVYFNVSNPAIADIECLSIFKNIEKQQYTGLKDKNDVEIYEGDILKVHSYTVTGLGKVGFNKGSFVFNKFEYPTSQVLHSFSEIEVIGNIYEHPHLLGELDGKGIRDT